MYMYVYMYMYECTCTCTSTEFHKYPSVAILAQACSGWRIPPARADNAIAVSVSIGLTRIGSRI